MKEITLNGKTYVEKNSIPFSERNIKKHTEEFFSYLTHKLKENLDNSIDVYEDRKHFDLSIDMAIMEGSLQAHISTALTLNWCLDEFSDELEAVNLELPKIEIPEKYNKGENNE